MRTRNLVLLGAAAVLACSIGLAACGDSGTHTSQATAPQLSDTPPAEGAAALGVQPGQSWSSNHANGGFDVRSWNGVSWTLSVRINGNQARADMEDAQLVDFIADPEDWTVTLTTNQAAK